MIDIVGKLAEMLKGGGQVAGAAVPGKLPLGQVAQAAAPAAADVPIAGMPTTAGPAVDAGVLPGGNSNMDILLRTLKGAQAGGEMYKQQQGQQPQMQAAPPIQMMPLGLPQGMVIAPNKQLPYQGRKY